MNLFLILALLERPKFDNPLHQASSYYPVPHIDLPTNYTTLHGEHCPAAGEAVSQYVLTGVALAITAVYITRARLFRLLPPWLRPFAAEQGPDRRAADDGSDDDLFKPKGWTHWTLILFLIAVFGFLLSLVPVVLAPTQPLPRFEIVPWIAVLVITMAERPTSTPRLLLALYAAILLTSASIFSAHFLDHDLLYVEPTQLARVVLAALAAACICAMPLRDPTWDVADIGSGKLPPSSLLRSPEDNLSLARFWTMSWVGPLAKLCKVREITVDDVWQLPFDFQHTRLYMAFREVKGQLLPCLIEANGLDLFISTTLAIVEKVLEVTNIRLTSKLYQALDAAEPSGAIYWCFVMLALDGLRQVSKTTANWYSRKAYERSRGETFIGLFGKLLTRAVPGSDATEKGPQEATSLQNGTGSPDNEYDELTEPQTAMQRFVSRICGRRVKKTATPFPAQPASNAKVVNLVRGDTYEISQRFWDFQKLVSQPVKIIFAMYYLVDIMGWPSAVGFALMVLFLTCNSLLVKRLIALERQRTAHSDKRAQAVSHFVEASRPLKLNGWTASWSARIMRFRDLEMRKRLQMALVTAAMSTLNVAGGTAYPLAGIALFTLVLRRGLPNDVIWPSLQLFGQLEASVKEAFDLVSAFWKTTIPVERVHAYMDEPDRDVVAPGSGSATPGTPQHISFRNASFAWPSTDVPVLRELNFDIRTGLTIVRGKVGAGKSSLLLAALNEMELREGSLALPDEPVGYAQQLPWLQNKTIRENILFQQPFDAHRYRQVLHACALAPDLAALVNGDMTKLEEGGVGLSGGQKARVALARAVYSPSRVLLLDDPLAPLDHDTATAVVRRLLQGPLAKGRTIVMVTHRDDLVLRIADTVIDVDGGTARVLHWHEVQAELAHPYHAVDGAATHDDADHSAAAHEELLSGGKIDPEDPSETGGVSWTVYLKYMRAGGWHMWALLAAAYGISRFCDISRARLLEEWGKDTASSAHLSGGGGGYWGLPDADGHAGTWLWVLAGLSAGQVVSYGIAQVLLARISVDAAQALFRAAVDKVSRATFRYHDTTPTGQLKNRLIADMSMVDGGILQPLEAFVFQLISLAMSLAAITTHQPALLGVLGVVSALFVYFFRLYVPASRCLRRMEMRYLTPIIANIGVMQDGLVTVRAMRVERHFQRRHLEAVDDFQKQDHFFWSMAFWLDFRLSMSSAAMRAALVLLMVALGTAASAVGFVLTQTTIAMAAVQQLCERFAQLQLDAVSLERVHMLDRIPAEPAGGAQPPDGWPAPGDAVVFDDVSFQYDDDLPPVLDRVTLRIPGGATCAVLGRTGSGKSTIANALLATRAPSHGTLTVGGVDLAEVDRAALRGRITFIQQDPTLFPGTLRDNLDPEGRFADAACAAAVARARVAAGLADRRGRAELVAGAEAAGGDREGGAAEVRAGGAGRGDGEHRSEDGGGGAEGAAGGAGGEHGDYDRA
ncbi:ABC transporter, transmembrane domain, type 1 [Cordyceps fumosorosea ARSEF 2679]|uniref:ABC transporter, transmembrane domain, type 1 n=1 Tax=Cordyceps fumosorosea (strain ARSEF 2679) TaxID=1081104 RepID=A0A162MBA4_CORFA|nr:ABC transporter, transmembrane domain, type 1 [Cordyceps fumosorosea ARSEF 2679]OAA53700.1 ABC transporter, transmembrane domain, type 1 [Cordyceps fumosorosea ARSEF 2679]